MNGYAIKQSTAVQPLIFLMIDSNGHISGKTGLSPTVTISKNGGAFAAPAGEVTEIGDGWYKVAANSTDSNTLGPLVLHATSTGADPVDVGYSVVAYDPQTVAVGALQPLVAGRQLSVAATTGAVELDSASVTAVQSGLATAAAVESVADTVAAYAARMALEVQLRGFPNVICRNADYLEATESEIRITVEDLTGAAITEIAGTPVASLSWLFGMGTEAAPNLIAGTCTWDGDSDELVIEIAKEATAGKQTGSLTWQIGVTIDTKKRWLGGGTTRLIERQF